MSGPVLADRYRPSLHAETVAELTAIERRTARHNTVAVALAFVLIAVPVTFVATVLFSDGPSGPFDRGCNGEMSYFYGSPPLGSTPTAAVQIWAARHPGLLPSSRWSSSGHDSTGEILRVGGSTYIHVVKIDSGWRVDKLARCDAS
jgi:hypothetical protein